MLNNKTIAVIIPAYNEAGQIGSIIEAMPAFVDRIVVINDFSADKTSEVVKGYFQSAHNHSSIEIKPEALVTRNTHNYADEVVEQQMKKELDGLIPSEVSYTDPTKARIILIEHKKNGGVGAAVARGYKWCKDYNIDCIAKVDGDGQMDLAELESICKPVVEEGIDYVKGNRLIHRGAWLVIPKVRYLGNSMLSILTKVASGYWHVSDTQTAYTAISGKALKGIKLSDLFHYYGYPNDMLVKLNISMCTLREVAIKPVYNVGEKSKMNLFKVIPVISWLLFKSFFKRLWIKYLFRDFHPLFLLYNFSFLLGAIWIHYFLKVMHAFQYGLNTSFETLFAFTFLGISSFQSLLFAMWMDIQDNERLYK